MLAARGWWWTLDYAYAAYWQLRGLLFPADPAPYLQAPRRDRPVLLIPGVYENWQFMHRIAELLHGAGHPVHVVSLLGYNRGEVPRMAALVSAYLEEADLRDVTIVAHSKGGLVGKRAMILPASAGRIRHMVAVNSPFAGSVYARLFLLPSIRAFSPRNGELRALAADLSVNHRITSVYSTFDPHIPGGSYLPGARNIQLDSAGHFRTLEDPALPGILLQALAEPDAQGN
ncbi:alpha/beta hydrolase [Arthrobacter sp. E918]|uniref:Alpha/beta hydrolase n=1 Tax=Arthrobacter mobilis TaxID=2724944 RepID=A0A7X6HCN4_9MICC|nr:alpha/beta hydrolase [Arthrobacter mobilis]